MTIEFGKMQSPAPQDWKSESWDGMKTQDVPFFELVPLAEGNTFAFRGEDGTAQDIVGIRKFGQWRCYELRNSWTFDV